MTKKGYRLLHKIVNCENVKKYFDGWKNNNPCRKIIESQKDFFDWKRVKKNEFRVPEPWSGHLSNVPILFISSNPSISENPNYPVWKKRKQRNKIIEFFVNRFDEKLTKDGKCYKGVDFWLAVKELAGGLIPEIRPGKYFALTEVVHCKSKKEKGVGNARSICSKLYLRDIIKASNAKVIVSLGKHAEKAINDLFDLSAEGGGIYSIPREKDKRYVVFLAHPSARPNSKLPKKFDARKRKKLKSILGQ